MLGGIGNFLKSYAEGLLQQQYGPDFRSKQAAAALEPERIRTGIEAQKTGIEATKSQMETQGLQRQQIMADLEERKNTIAALRAKGIVSAEAEKLLLDKAHSQAQTKLAEAQAVESGARTGEHKARAGLYGAQAGYFTRRPGVSTTPTRSRQVPTDVRQEIEDKARTQVKSEAPSFWSRLKFHGVMPSVQPLPPEFDPSTTAYEGNVGKRAQEMLKLRGYNPAALSEISQPVVGGAPAPAAGNASPQIGFDPQSNSYFMVVGGRRIPLRPEAVDMAGLPPPPGMDEGYEP